MTLLKLNSKLKVVTLFVALFATAFSVIPNVNSLVSAVECSSAPQVPTFNPFPVTYDDLRPECMDYAVIQGRKVGGRYPQSVSEAQAGVNANIGEEVEVLIYFHNGTGDSDSNVMRNARVNVVTPTTNGTSQTITATLSADNAASKSGSWKINTPANSKLEVIPNSGLRYNSQLNIVQSGFNLGNGSYTLGDLRGCFEYAGFLKFKVRVVQGDTAPTGQLNIVKEVRNVTQSGSFSHNTQAKRNDVVEYRIKVKTTQGTLQNVTVKDNFPSSQLIYEQGSLQVNGQFGFSGLSGAGLVFSSLDTNGVTITYRAKVSIDNGTITNTATAQAGVPQNVPPVTDTATVNVNTVVQNGTLNIEKSVRNLTTGGGFSDQANARTGETVEYKIRVYASVTTVNNVTVRDNFPSSQLTYVQGSLLVNGQQGFSGLSGTGLVFSSISTSGIDITYRATVSAGPGSTITNTAQASSPNANSVQDTARVNVTGEVINNTTLSINKEVRNITKNTSFSKNQTAQINDQVEYRIVVRNTGSAVAQDVRVTDNATFANSGLNLSGNINATKNFTGSFSSALSFGSLQVGEQVDITYRAHVSRDGFTIQNTAAAYANNAPSVQDSAFLDVGANKGNLTIAKAVRKAYSGNSFAKTAYVQDGDTVEYQIQVSANSGTVNNVRLTENIINNFTLNFGSARLEGSVISDSFYGGTISLGNLTQGQTKTLTFFGIVRNNTTTQITITNTAQATGDNVTSVQDTATVYVAGQQPQGNRQIAVNKNVRNNTTGTSFQNSVNASTGDTVTYEITISNTGTLPLENVRLTDTWTNGINVNVNTVRVDSSSVFPSSYGSGFEVSLGSIGTGQQRRVTFDATVTIQSGTVTNTARASASSVNEVQDDALVTVQFSGTPNLVYSKSAFNDTRNADATTVAAQREDYITYTLTVRNTGNAAHNNFVVSDDLSGILPLADMVDLKGGSLNGSTISYPAVNIAQGETVTKSFRVRVKSSLAPNLSYTMVNTYGNTVRVNINTPENPGPIIAPKTGVDGHTAVAFGSLLSGAFLIIRKRNAILKSIFA